MNLVSFWRTPENNLTITFSVLLQGLRSVKQKIEEN